MPTTDDSETEGDETFTLTLSAPGGGFPSGVALNPSATRAQATIAASDAPANNPPTTSAAAVSTPEDMAYTFEADDFPFSDTDSSDSLQEVRIDSLPTPASLGALALDGTAVIVAQVIPVAGIPNLVYTPVANANGEATFTFSVSDGTDFSTATGTATVSVTQVNDPATGRPTILTSSSPLDSGSRLNVSTRAVRDVDGVPSSFTYQWNRHDAGTDTPIVSATSFGYTTTPGDIGARITVTLSFTDNDGNKESLTSQPTEPVVAGNSPPTGILTIDGDLIQGQTLTVNTDDLVDPNGLPNRSTFTYRWLAGVPNASVTEISGANSATYTLTQAEVGKSIRASVAFTDDDGYDESVNTAFRGLVANINDPPSGLPTITGTTTQGETLTANTSGISDADGPASLPFTYQWNTHSSGTDTAIDSATSATYILTADDVGDQITVSVRYTDAGGTNEGPLTSAPTAAVAAASTPNNPPSGLPTITGTTTQGETLTANTSGISDADGPASLSFTYQWNRNDGTTDTAISGANSATYILTPGDVGDQITVSVRYTDAGGEDEGPLTSVPTAAVAAASTPNNPPSGLPTITGTTTQGETLTANTSGISDADGPASLSFTYQWNRHSSGTNTAISGETNSTYTLTGADVGDQITVSVRYTDAGGTNEGPLTSAPTAAVAAASTPNNPPSGLPTITGTTTQGETLTANTSGISDADGPASLSFTYQWNRNDGTTDTAISGETNSTYTLSGADVGQMITVAVRYTDAGGEDEGPLTSVPTAAVAAASTPNNPPSGLPTITGTTTQGETLTANTSGISDADGPASLSFTYQWNRHSSGTNTAISGETNSTYTLTGADVGDQITVSVRYTDAGGTNEGPLTSAPTAAVAAASTPNNPPSGLPTITGTTTQGETLTANTSGISDADGPASLSFTYQWNRNDGTTDTAISGETNSTYTLSGADVGQMITVAVRYTDAGGTNEGPLTSVPTAAVIAAPPPEVLDEEQAMAQGVEPASTDSAGTTITLPTSEPVDVSMARTDEFMVTSTLDGRSNHCDRALYRCRDE